MYEDQGLPLDAPERFRIEILFSPGVSYDLAAAPPRPDHTFPSVRRVPMQVQVSEGGYMCEDRGGERVSAL